MKTSIASVGLLVLVGCFPPRGDAKCPGGMWVNGPGYVSCEALDAAQARIEARFGKPGFLRGWLLHEVNDPEGDGFNAAPYDYRVAGTTQCDLAQINVAIGPQTEALTSTSFMHEAVHAYDGCPVVIELGKVTDAHPRWTERGFFDLVQSLNTEKIWL